MFASRARDATIQAVNNELQSLWLNPPREHGAIPFWFWNDELDDAEIIRQIREFHAKGFMGFTIHPRIGLSRRVGYLTDEYFRLMRLAIDEAARLGMKVVCTDEASYPSGAAQGKVVAENPEHAQKCLIALYRKLQGPNRGYWRPNPGRDLTDKLLCVVAVREISPEVFDPASFTILPHDEHELVHYDLPEGRWRLVAVWRAFSGSCIRGAFEDEDDNHATAPAAADLLCPDAVACYIRLTHDAIYANLKDHFGKTFVAIFVDEPSVLGRYPQRGPEPREYTDGLIDEVQRRWGEDVKRWLPALWLNCGERTDAFRDAWKRAVADRLDRVFYAPQGKWCKDHGIALTGHPLWSNELAGLRHFQWPGQDLVWRFVLPNSPTANEGPDSLCCKSASSMTALLGARYSAMETIGAYGWRTTLDDIKWLLDWHTVRGNNLFFLHACFYSIRGRRAYESEPDVGIHNVWWRYFGLLGDYLRRVCWMITDGELVCDVAILSDPTSLSWNASRELQQNQIDFLFVDSRALEEATIEDRRLCVARQRFGVVVMDAAAEVSEKAQAKLDAFSAAGGLVMNHGPNLVAEIVKQVGRDVDWPNAPDLRVLHYRRAGREFYFLVNEGEAAIEGELSIAISGAVDRWDGLDGSARRWPARLAGNRTHLRLKLDRRESAVLCIDPSGQPDPSVAPPAAPGEILTAIAGPWRALDESGKSLSMIVPGDWAQQPGWQIFAGTVRFAATFDLAEIDAKSPIFLDLGRVGDIAEVHLNGQRAGVRAWGPYLYNIASLARAGVNELDVRVTNSIANRFDGAQLPSGLMGPVVLRRAAAD